MEREERETSDMDDTLAEQLAYYRERAGEYDRWFRREGRYDRGEEAKASWFAQVDDVRAALIGMPLEGADVLELAGGTGIWTEMLVTRARHLTVVDASPEMVDENRRRLGAAASRVTYILADLFTWTPERSFDVVVFCFWISHVPEDHLDAFLTGVAQMIRPGGAVFFVDGRREPTSTAADHVLPPAGEQIMVRHLDDGRPYRVVKNFWSAAELEDRFRRAGLEVRVDETDNYFMYGRGVRPLSR